MYQGQPLGEEEPNMPGVVETVVTDAYAGSDLDTIHRKVYYVQIGRKDNLPVRCIHEGPYDPSPMAETNATITSIVVDGVFQAAVESAAGGTSLADCVQYQLAQVRALMAEVFPEVHTNM